ncbi:ABC transporter permease [Halobacillus massiliensis]|uniref:ABC transporter permease n=1 Tax=Halobacillus massiliensis TaxID=1926286 RepID=UPI0009E24AD9|nr:ABC transporter permease [Halobacillus massiliensis]
MNGFSLFRHEMRATVRRPAPLFLSVVIPLALLFITFLSLQSFFTEQQEPVEAVVIDKDQTFQTEALIHQISEEKRMEQAMKLEPLNEEEAFKAFENGEAAGIMIIPEGFTESLMNGENDPIKVITSKDQPLHGSLLNILLSSGAQYISASQSAVNTVYDLHIRNLPADERSIRLQEAIVTYTLFALDRNDAFVEELVISGASIGWENHAVIAVTHVLAILFMAFYQVLDGKTMTSSIQMRWRMAHLTFAHHVLVKQLKWWLLLFTILELFVLFIHVAVTDIPYSSLLHIGLGLIALLISSLAGLLYSLNIPLSFRFLIFIIAAIIGALSAGVFLPGIYLPEWLQTAWNPFRFSYDIFQAFLLEQETDSLLNLAVWGIGLNILGLIAGLGKEKRDAYLSFFTS